MRRFAIAACLCLAACRATESTVASVTPTANSDEVWSQRAPPPKHGDERAAAPGTVRTSEEPLRPLEGAPTGKVWLLDMYQSALAEKDELAKRASDASRERDAAVAHAADLEKARADLEARNAGLASELRDLQAKSLELARRLAESELARLSAEKTALDGGPTGARSDKP